ncbi:hypothetical protein Tco_0855575 [Tanacetum coccineum]
MTLRDPNNDSTFSGGGDDEGSVAANSVMPALADGDRTAKGSAGARCSSSSPSSSSFSTSSSSLSSSDDSLS